MPKLSEAEMMVRGETLIRQNASAPAEHGTLRHETPSMWDAADNTCLTFNSAARRALEEG